jgi:hypothetical protein
MKKKQEIALKISPQPTETTCGPTCLHAVYTYYGLNLSIDEIIDEVPSLEDGGTIAVMLAQHALRNGFHTKIYTYNLGIFDPTWFQPNQLNPESLQIKLKERGKKKSKKHIKLACQAYIDYLSLGGELRMHELDHQLIRTYLKKGIPILTGLSSTYLYQSERVYYDGETHFLDDVMGDPEGHFVVLESYDSHTRTVTVLDPYQQNPYSEELKYTIDIDRLINSILLGVLTHDANLLIVEKSDS